jgi:hypothetical protein
MNQKRREGAGIRVSIPRSLYDGILRIQLDEGLDFNAAANKAANLMEPNGQLFREAVEKQAQELGRSQFLAQLNKGRASIEAAAYNAGAEYVRTHEIHFEAPCSVCGKPMKFSSNDANFEKEVKAPLHGAFKNWYHVPCGKK